MATGSTISGDGDDALELAVKAFSDLPQHAAPGELWAYSNAGFDLAGRAIENVRSAATGYMRWRITWSGTRLTKTLRVDRDP